MKHTRLVILGTLIVELASACVGRVAPAASFPEGTFASPVRGGVTQQFSGDGTYIVAFPGHNPHTGTYTVSQDEIVLTDDNEICAGVAGRYKWAFDGQALTFTAIDDGCAIRRIDWPSQAWIKQP
jgi:hypothetical protein